MSSRALKRLNKANLEDELAKYHSPVPETPSEEESEPEVELKRKANAFSLLNDDDSSLSSSESSSESSDDSEVQSQEPAQKDTKKLPNKTVPQKRRGKAVDEIDDDELDQLLADLKLKEQPSLKKEYFSSDGELYESADEEDYGQIEMSCPIYTEGGKLLTAKKYKRVSHLLKVHLRDLNPDKEYENLFGKLSTSAIDAADSTSSSFISPEMLKEIKKLSKRVRGWAGRDHRSLPGTNRKLTLTKIRDDWLPVQKKPLSLDELSMEHLSAMFQMKYKNDWKDIIEEDLLKDKKVGIKYYQAIPGPMYSTAATTEFFLSTCIQPDHESLIRLMQKSPYSLETILQVASILQRQGDNSNTNGLIERALFIFDWALPNTLELGDGLSRLPFEFFLNRQIYLTCFRYISVLTQKSTFYTAFNYCKLILSFDPTDDPYGVRYFIDFYAFMASEYKWIVDFFNSQLVQTYSEWKTPALMYTLPMAYYQMGKHTMATEALKKAYIDHPYTGHEILEKLGEMSYPWLLSDVSDSVKLASAIYTVRLPMLCEDQPMKEFIKRELANVIESVGKPQLAGYYLNNQTEIPNNLLRHVVLSNESSAMAKIPESFWKENDVYEFDVLPPAIGTSVYNYIDDDRMTNEMMQQSLQTEEIRQIENLLMQNVREA